MVELFLFISFLVIGVGAYGGGIATIPLIEHELVFVRQWLTPQDMAELIAVAQMTPGPIAINAATFAGYRVAGFTGALVSTIAVITPSLILCSLLIHFFNKLKNTDLVQKVKKAVSPAVMGLILSAVVIYGQSSVADITSLSIALVSFLVLLFFRQSIHPVLLIIVAGITGVFLF
ncbi:chromate transporter [Chitinispirillales bacterium ANBcel5]|uniref:chromate transporter n=1 Tax=Cellulosispirillum alkaliphilum TaxID=3039283 RepID=UPI002A55D49F|nr:chromate transporter [Chitinispirillales bacterium ANBcel5]